MAQDIKDMKLDWVPNQKELDEYAKETKNVYKGTFVVCLVYGLVALGLILAGAFTEWGREYIFGKMLAATATFVFGAIFIVLYLTMAIYDMKPKQKRTKQDVDNGIICPDYWKLERVDDANFKTALKNQNDALVAAKTKDFKLTEINDPRLQFKCKLDTNIQDLVNMNAEDSRYNIGFDQTTPNKSNINNPDYIYVDKDSGTNPIYPGTGDLGAYATLTSLGDVAGKGQLFTGGSSPAKADVAKFPLKCNEVYPRILEEMDKNTPEGNKYRCEYAKACDIPWTGLGCKYEMRKA